MRNSRQRITTIMKMSLGVGLTCGLALSASASNQNIARRHTPARQSAPTLVAPPAPSAPPTLQDEPTQSPQVTYREGQLTINAANCTLVDILRAVRTQTGAMMDVPGNPSDRVVGHFGPGPARDVMAALLNGSRYNYVLLGSATNPNALEHVILTAQIGGADTAPRPQPPPQAPPAQSQLQPTGLFGDAEQADDAGTISNGNTDAEQPPDVDQQQTDDQTAQSDDNGFQPQQGPPGGIRSPQQLLQELQQRQQQGQNGPIFQPGAGAPVPGSQQQ